MLNTAGEKQNIRRLVIVGICGLSSILIYLFVFVLPFWLPTYARIPFPPLSGFDSPGPALLAPAFIALFALYYIAYRAVPETASRALMALVFAVPVVAAVLLVFMTTFASADISEYIVRAHMYAQLHVNAMATAPSAFPNDPLLPFAYWVNQATGYGPIWEMMETAVAWIVGTDRLALLIAFKSLVAAHFLATLPVMYIALRAWNPALALRGTLLFGWSPLMLFEFPGNGHNDAVMLFWLVVVVALVLHKRFVWAMLALNVAILIKFIPAILVPLLLVYWWKNRGEQPVTRQLAVMGGALLAMAVSAYVLFLPYGLDNTLRAYSGVVNLAQESLPWFLMHIFVQQGVPFDTVVLPIGRLIGEAVLLIFIVWYTVRIYRQRGEQDRRYWLLLGCFEVVYAYLFFTSLRIYPWYVSWPLVFAPFLSGRFGQVERAIFFGFTSLSIYFIENWHWPVDLGDFDSIQLAIVGVVVGPQVLFYLIKWAGSWRKTTRPAKIVVGENRQVSGL